MYNPYNAYQNPYSQMPQPYTSQSFFNQPSQNILPPQQVIQVNGKQSVDAIRMSPNSSVLLMDNSAPIVWLCVSDGVGNVTSTAYDIMKHQETPPVDTKSLEMRVSKLEEIINDQSHVTSSEQSSNTEKPAEHKADAKYY